MDQRLFAWDVLGSLAHARMLGRQGIIPAADAAVLVEGLSALLRETREFSGDYEDVHSLVEARLGALAGQASARLHTARSRNDQVATDTRLFARAAVIAGVDALADLQDALVSAADSVGDAVMPGYTHMQRAQPVLVAHHLLAYVEMFARDANRLRDAYPRVDVLPLGSGALAGSPYPLDREYVARLLGFSDVSHNSMDAVGDRDFLLEHLSDLSIIAMHLSRLAEELVLWSTVEFGFVALDESMTTGSSIMPQKRNPDVAELLRGKTGRVYGALVALLVTMKGLPMAYNRDLQEDKGPYFEAIDLVDDGLRLAAAMVRGATWNLDRMGQAADDALIGATDLADHLTRRGVPFRQAHEVVGRIVRRAEEDGRGLASFSLAELQEFSPHFAAAAVGLQAPALVRARDVVGGTAPTQVTQQLGNARTRLVDLRSWSDTVAARLPTLDSVRAE